MASRKAQKRRTKERKQRQMQKRRSETAPTPKPDYFTSQRHHASAGMLMALAAAGVVGKTQT